MPINIDAYRALAASIRPIASPLHTTRVTVRTRTWSGDEIGTGDFTDSDFLIGQEVRVSKLTQKEVISSGGVFSFDDVKVTHITPPFTANGGGGYSLSQVAPMSQIPPLRISGQPLPDDSDPAPNPVEYFYVLTGDITGNYRLKTVTDDHALHYTLFLTQIDTHANSYAR